LRLGAQLTLVNRSALPATPQTRPSVADKQRTFQDLHKGGCFVIPNPWDAGSARFLQSLGFKALATTSFRFAWSQGRRDGAISWDMAFAHLHDLAAQTDHRGTLCNTRGGLTSWIRSGMKTRAYSGPGFGFLVRSPFSSGKRTAQRKR
jgi:hypothetical protein